MTETRVIYRVNIPVKRQRRDELRAVRAVLRDFIDKPDNSHYNRATKSLIAQINRELHNE